MLLGFFFFFLPSVFCRVMKWISMLKSNFWVQPYIIVENVFLAFSQQQSDSSEYRSFHIIDAQSQILYSNRANSSVITVVDSNSPRCCVTCQTLLQSKRRRLYPKVKSSTLWARRRFAFLMERGDMFWQHLGHLLPWQDPLYGGE